jgi:hypothetical protein
VVVLVPELLQLEKLPRLRSAEDQRNAVGIDGRGRAGFQSQMGSNAAAVTLELDEPAVKVVAF